MGDFWMTISLILYFIGLVVFTNWIATQDQRRGVYRPGIATLIIVVWPLYIVIVPFAACLAYVCRAR